MLNLIRFDEGMGPGCNTYLLYDPDTKDAVIIDPGYSGGSFMDAINENGLNLKKIVLTHGHYDHIGGVEKLREETGAEVVIPETDKDFLIDSRLNLSDGLGRPGITCKPAEVTVKEGDVIEVSPGNELKVIETPGHTPGGVCYVGDGYMFVGDLLFAGSIGRTDFPGGSYSEIMDSLERLIKYDDDTLVLPGHGAPTTIGREKAHNPFLTRITQA